MDELGALILGKAPEAKASVVTDELLDRLKKVESGKDPFAINKDTKAMGAYQFMPETVQMLHKQGMKFNPFDEKEARGAAKAYLEQLVQRNNGDVNKALAQYGGFVTKDPSSYVNKVMQGAAPAQQTQAPDDELGAMILGKQTQPNKPMQPTFDGGAGRGSYAGFDPQAKAIAEGQSTRGPKQPTGGPVLNGAVDLYNQFQQGKRALGEIITAPLAGAATSVLGPATGIVASLRSGQYGTPEGVRIGQEQSANLQKQLSPEIRTPQAQAVLGGLQQAFEASKVPPSMMPELAGFAPLAGPAAQQARQTVGQAVQAGKQIPGVIGKQLGVGELELQRQFEAKGGQPQPQIQPQAKPGSIGAAKVENNPYAGQITGEESARGQFPQVKLSKTAQDVPVTEQQTRAQIANEILGNTGQVRPGVITGNENLLRNEHTKAKMANPTPEGELYKQQIANEQVALSNYAQKRIENTGASPTLITPYERGQRINDAFAGEEGLAGFFKGEKKKLYDEVTQKVGDNPIQTSNVQNLFGDKQFKAGLGLKGNEGVAKAAEDLINHAKTVGFKDEMGNVYAPNTVGAWTAVQKALNSNWTKDNAGVIKQINQAIERDIGQAGGLDLLKKADSLHQAEKVLFGSKGIKEIFGDIDPNGVQTATAFDAIPQKLNSMPLDQWRHIYDTAEKVSKGTISGPIDKTTGLPKWTVEVPQDLRVSAQSAMNEMRGNLAREIYQAGAAKAGEWNQNAVNKILNARADKIKMAFTPEEQQAFHTLNMGGYLMPGVHSYEGAGQQLRRVGLIEGNLGKLGTTAGAGIGGAIAGPGGAAVGGYLGGKAGMAGSEKLAAKALTKEAQKSQKEMQKASQLGTKLSDLGK
jgi:hypothetical protein